MAWHARGVLFDVSYNFTLEVMIMRLRYSRARRSVVSAFVFCFLLGFGVAPRSVSAQLQWRPQGPGPIINGQSEGVVDDEVVGGVNAIVAHPTDVNTVYLGAVNGGIWKTTRALDAHPTWIAQTDQQGSLSVGALEFDPTDGTHLTLVAGIGRGSSKASDGGALTGLLRTTNGGTTWMPIDGSGTLRELNIVGVAPRGATIVVAVNRATPSSRAGVWRSVNTGGTWTAISGGANTGLPEGATTDLASNPANPDQLFTNAGRTGLYRSNNRGATWSKVSNNAIDTTMATASNIKLSIGMSNNVYVAIVQGGQLGAVFRSGDSGTTWVAMDVPRIAEGGIHPGGQGGIHLSIAADRVDPQVVYVGGDRQAGNFNLERTIQNSIGARDYSGCLFRGDASKPSDGRWVHLTHSNTMGAPGGGTAHGSAPHADSRDMATAPDGSLIEADDGGVYRRTLPRTNTGDWTSMNGDLRITEFHATAWDSNAHIIIAGAQDTGTPQQTSPSDFKWTDVSRGDGGVVAVDASAPGVSTRYSSYYDLNDLRRQVFKNNQFENEVRVSLRVVSGADLARQFYTPLKLNTVSPSRLVIGGANSVYESLDQGDSISEIGFGITANANGIAYGAVANADVLYIGSGPRVYVRRTASPALLERSTTYPGGVVAGVALDPQDWKMAVVADSTRVFRTADSATTWTEITGNLRTLSPGTLRSVAYSTNTTSGSVVVGSNTGVFEAPGPSFSTWTRLGTNLPMVPVLSLEYNAADHTILAGTLGRGAWTLPIAFSPPPITTSPAAIPVAANVQPSPASPRASSVQLAPGVVIDTAQSRVYVATPRGAIESVEIARGLQIWTTNAGAKPLAVAGPRLLAQAEPGAAENALKIAIIDRSTGRMAATGAMPLPASVRPAINETLAGKFVATAEPTTDTDAVVAWQFEPSERRQGIEPGTLAALPPPPPPAVAPSAAEPAAPRMSGAFRVNLATGATFVDPGLVPVVSGTATPQTFERFPGLPQMQTLSADARHILASERVADDSAWDKYQVVVVDRATGQRVGQFRSHLAAAPFYVADSTLIYQTAPYVRRTGDGIMQEPLKIRAIDLRTGNEIWNKEVRDTALRGPFPP